MGSLTPSSDSNNHVVSAIFFQGITFNGTTTFKTYVKINAANLGQAYFAALTIPSLGVSLSSSSAGYSTGTGVSQWVWPGALSLVAGNSYSVKLG